MVGKTEVFEKLSEMAECIQKVKKGFMRRRMVFISDFNVVLNKRYVLLKRSTLCIFLHFFRHYINRLKLVISGNQWQLAAWPRHIVPQIWNPGLGVGVNIALGQRNADRWPKNLKRTWFRTSFCYSIYKFWWIPEFFLTSILQNS